ncbi:MAG: SusC/RagA family TonB-linked outer membrane protein [Chitinophagaceae bacterium]|nr:SusC/RagA family TonB-linked outer membrane protein [Chitinophagaceae bacterium]
MLLFSLQAFSQNTVTGKVTDAKDGSPVPGVTVTVKGTTTAAQTQSDGTFSLVAPAGSTLVFTSVGFTTQEAPVRSGAVNISFAQSNQQLNEIVVVGYGTQKRKEVTGSITRIGADKIANVASPSFESALAGKAAGVSVSTSGGTAGSGAVVRIRGISSISVQGDPLYVIDGLPIDATYLNGPTRSTLGQDRNPLANINPNDIESVEILKDAAAAGIYGSRGSNGVILITTKRGRGRGKLDFSTRVGLSTYTVKPKYVDKNTWLAIRQEAWENDGNTGPQQNLPGALGGYSLSKALADPATDWWDMATRTGVSQAYNLSYSKGTKKFNIFTGGSYSKEQSYLVGNDYNRIGLRANVDYKPTSKVTISANAAYNSGISHLINNAWNGGLGLAMSTALPYYQVYDDNTGKYFKGVSDYNWDPGGSFYNFKAQSENKKFRTAEQRYLGGLTGSYKVTKNLELKGIVSVEQNNSVFNSFTSAFYTNQPFGNAEDNFNKYTNYQLQANAIYNLEINDDHKFTFLLGSEYQEQETKNRYVFVDSTSSPLYDGGKNNVYDTKKDAAKFVTNFQKRFQSFLGRVNYNYLGKYFLQASLRRDASSKFRENNRFAYFPTVSGAWSISDEDFMDKLKAFNYLKLRAGWGLTGNDGLPWNAGYPSVNTGRNEGDNYGNNPTIYPSNLGNPDLKWETSSNLDIALEFGVLKNRISGELGVYRKQSRDLLLDVPITIYNGAGDRQWQNQGKVLNEGIEFTLNTINYKSEDFTWSSNFNIAHNFNEVTDIGNLLPDAIMGGTNETRVVPGYSIGTIFTVRYYGVDPADGLPIYLDRNGNQTKVLNVNPRTGDKVPIANVLPDFTGGITNTFKYKNIELNTLFTFQGGGHIWDNSGKRSMGYVTDWNIYAFMAGNYWRKPGDIAKYPKPTLKGYPGVEGSYWDNNSSVQIYDASYIRLRELSLSYIFPQAMIGRWKMSNAKAYISAYNLLLFTKYPVGDPEGGRDGEDDAARNQSPNANFLNPPLQKSFNVGINVSF